MSQLGTFCLERVVLLSNIYVSWSMTGETRHGSMRDSGFKTPSRLRKSFQKPCKPLCRMLKLLVSALATKLCKHVGCHIRPHALPIHRDVEKRSHRAEVGA